MRVAKFWHKTQQTVHDAANKAYWLTCWGSSNRSLAEAQDDAASILTRWRSRLQSGAPINEYEYADAAIREELIEEFYAEDGQLSGAITRNRYGALVLNTASMLIADIDLPKGGGSFIGRLFGRKQPDQAALAAKIEDYVRQRSDLAGRLYATKAGLRLIISSRDFQPGATETQTLLTELGSDWLYQNLCARQNCFRARLTPKPWRIGLPSPPNRFPRPTAEAQNRFDGWLREYQQRSSGATACHLMATLGGGWPSAAIAELIAAHDRRAVDAAAPLA